MYSDISVAYRSTNLIDILMLKRDGAHGYKLSASPTFGGSFVDILTSTVSNHYLDPGVDSRKLSTLNTNKHVRAVFNPSNFDGTVSGYANAGITDSKPFWLKFTPIDAAGSSGTQTGPLMVLTAQQRREPGRMNIQGTAPNGATVANSQVLYLPYRMSSFAFVNSGASILHVAFQIGGDEIPVAANGGQLTIDGPDSASVLLVRGAGGTTAFTASFSMMQSN